MADSPRNGVHKAVQILQDERQDDLSILKLVEPFANDDTAGNQSPGIGISPTSLEADLAHYKDLFSKLRFSYLEQVTKEKFLRAIVGEPPLVVEAAENTALEGELAEVKASLKAQKDEVAALVAQLEVKGAELGRRYEMLRAQAGDLDRLPSAVGELREMNKDLEDQLAPNQADSENGGNSSYRFLGLPAAQELLKTRGSEMASVDAELASLQAAVPRQEATLERLERELVPLNNRRETTIRAAEEAKRRKLAAAEGTTDGDDRGRWLTAQEAGLKALIGEA